MNKDFKDARLTFMIDTALSLFDPLKASYRPFFDHTSTSRQPGPYKGLLIS